jgi:PAS domain S-box-containing protein
MPNPGQEVLWLRNQAVSYTNVSVCVADARADDVPLIDVNPAFVRMTGYTREESIGRNCRFLQGPRSDRRVAGKLGEAIRTQTPATVVILNYRRDGGTFWNEINIAPVFDDSGSLSHFIASQMDVTQRVRNDEFQDVLIDIDTALGMRLDPAEVVDPVVHMVANRVADSCAIYAVDNDGQIARLATSMSDELFEETHTDNRRAIEGSMSVPMFDETVARVIATGELHTVTYEFPTSNPELPFIPYSCVFAPIVGPSRVYGAFSFAIDMTIRPTDGMDEHLAIEIGHRLGNVFEMSTLYNDLRKAIDVRDEFLSIAAHELRTPIASIKGYSQLLMRGLARGTLLPERLRLGLRTIETASSQLTTLTNDLLEVSRNGLNRMPLHLERVSIYDYVNRFLVERQGLRHDHHEYELLSDDPNLFVEIDVARVDQILSNLASNAVKYSDAGKPVRVAIDHEDGGVAIRIADEGVGIEGDDLDLIFEPFKRARNAIDSSVPGMGLGLFISRNIAERHGGSLTAHSDGIGAGTTFRLWLPVV